MPAARARPALLDPVRRLGEGLAGGSANNDQRIARGESGGLAQVETGDRRNISLDHSAMIALVGAQGPAGHSVELDAGTYLAARIGRADAQAAGAREQVDDRHARRRA
jgi:hypothetical protein